MADAWGMLVCVIPDESIVNAKGLAEELSNLQLCNSDSVWKADDKNVWFIGEAQYPTVIPLTLDEDEEQSEMSLQEISRHLSCYVSKGEIIVACSSNEKNRYVTYESLKVTADGKVEFTSRFAGAVVYRENHQVYEPDEKEQTWLALNKKV